MKQAAVVRLTLALLVGMALLSACDPSHQAASPTAHLATTRGASTIVLDNTAPAQIDLLLGAGIEQSLPQVPAHFWITPTFYASSQQSQPRRTIQFSRGETLICNDIVLPMTSRGAYDSEKLPAPGTMIHCLYRSPQGQASFSFSVPGRATLLSPGNDATITRSTHTPLTIRTTSTCKAVKVVTGYLNAHGTYQSSAGDEQYACTAQQSVSTLDLPAGPGLLGVEEIERVDAVPNDAGFHALTFMVTTWTVTAVTWQ